MEAKYSVKRLEAKTILNQVQITIAGTHRTIVQLSPNHTTFAVVDTTGSVTKSKSLNGKMMDNIFDLKSAAKQQADWMNCHQS